MDFGKTLGNFAEKLQAGALPTERDTLEACVGGLSMSLIEIFITEGRCGVESVLTELNSAFSALANKKDPLLKSLGPVERQALSGFRSMLRRAKEGLHAQSETAPSTEVPTPTRDTPTRDTPT